MQHFSPLNRYPASSHLGILNMSTQPSTHGGDGKLGNQEGQHSKYQADLPLPPPPNGSASQGFNSQQRNCPYHSPILECSPSNPPKFRGATPLHSFLYSPPAEQASLFMRPDSVQSSLAKGCTCGRLDQIIIDGITHDAINSLGSMLGTQFEEGLKNWRKQF
ncbi:uncharacterized protein BDR25DRAFT_53788 [Lindgomyces ingoldianus]|uniref:Uncharacterized protein n=1 Tax=Lindgomyces ingoldianus TaxID=673940 RepID=A0ACB6QRZ8_9PLEO|nr:uncharacterized protein BDR25DRAFT_53788 [Lindgomyces ingoldianus]KAF2468875.1 hypothetical protein BDR25DRAFT_53788 [Lindgomyces ingoldianus]